MKVIVINGSATTGKDKFVSYFKENKELRVKNYSSVDKIKVIAELCFGWDGKKSDRARKFLSDLKKAWADYEDGPFKDIVSRIDTDLKWTKKKGKDTDKNIYFVHIREPEEIQKMKEKYKEDCITLLVDKPIESIPDNYSDMNVKNFTYDFFIDNDNGLDSLRDKALKFSQEIF